MLSFPYAVFFPLLLSNHCAFGSASFHMSYVVLCWSCISYCIKSTSDKDLQPVCICMPQKYERTAVREKATEDYLNPERSAWPWGCSMHQTSVQMALTNKIMATCIHIIFRSQTNLHNRGFFFYLHDAGAWSISGYWCIEFGKNKTWKRVTWEEKQKHRTLPASTSFHSLPLLSCLHLCTFTYCTCINI